MDWTEQQKEAITRRDSGLIVSAAAGSGKTSVLVERLLRILMDESPENKVPADHMIVVTFTNDAAAEMRSRLYQALDQKLQEQPENTWLYQQQIRLQNAHICTISSFCFELIRENLGDQGITQIRILNETEAKLIASKAADTVLNRWHAERQEENAAAVEQLARK
ncbi:MAG: UvrD-helicase domain-containing protein [Ruminococcus callidus]